jgi:hypothetical protein
MNPCTSANRSDEVCVVSRYHKIIDRDLLLLLLNGCYCDSERLFLLVLDGCPDLVPDVVW